LLVAGVVAAVAVVFLAGVGSGMLILTNRMTDMVGGLAMSGQLPGGAGAPGGSGQPQLPGGGQQRQLPGAPDEGAGDPDLQKWAEEQGLPAGVPDQILGQLQQQFPDGIPDDVKQQLQQLMQQQSGGVPPS
ncbi:MAG: hypothetical protein ACRCZD_12870, partial [Phycicoccus sp.]